jgi:hypothetical protein
MIAARLAGTTLASVATVRSVATVTLHAIGSTMLMP